MSLFKYKVIHGGDCYVINFMIIVIIHKILNFSFPDLSEEGLLNIF